MIDSTRLKQCNDIIEAELTAMESDLVDKIKVHDTPDATAAALAGIAYEKQAIITLRQRLNERLNSQQLKESTNDD